MYYNMNSVEIALYIQDIRELMEALNIECYHDARIILDAHNLRIKMGEPERKIYFWSTRNKIGYDIGNILKNNKPLP